MIGWSRAALVLVPSSLALAACTAPAEDVEHVGGAEQAATADIDSMTRNADGTYSVACRDGRTEASVTVARILASDVCKPLPPPAPSGACAGPQLTYDELVKKLAPGASFADLGRFSGAVDSRVCNAVSGCSAFAPTGKGTMEIWANGTSPYYYQPSYAVGTGGDVGLFTVGDKLEMRFRTDPYGWSDKLQVRLVVACDVDRGAGGVAEVGDCHSYVQSEAKDAPAWGNPSDRTYGVSFPAATSSVYGRYDGSQSPRVSAVQVTASCVSFSTEEMTPALYNSPSRPVLHRWRVKSAP